MDTETVEAGGLKFETRFNSSDRIVVEDNIERRSYEKHGVKVNPGGCWMDIGGYIGSFAAGAISRGAKVVSFEPDPDNAEMFRRNMVLNNFESVLIQKAVVQANSGPMLLHKNTFRNNWAANTLFPHWKKPRPTVEVECLGFLEAFSLAQEQLGAEELSIKLDAEGAEIEIFENLSNSLPIKQMTAEYHFSVDPSCERYWRIVKNLESCGLRVKATAKVPEHGDWPGLRMKTIQMFCTKP